MSTPIQTTCPNCQHTFNIENAIKSQIELEMKASFTAKEQELKKKEAEFLELRKNETERLAKKLEEEKQKQAIQLKKEIEESNGQEIKALQEMLKQTSAQVNDFKQKEIEMMRKEQQMQMREKEMELNFEKKWLASARDIEEKARKMEQEKNEMRIKENDLRVRELEKQLDDTKKMLIETQKKADQGSMQLQGEVQEHALEDLLRSTFPFDLIEEVGKGIKGADVIQNVRNSTGQICGKMIYESKRTKDFSQQWIDKLKNDLRSQGADIAIIVTEAMPKDMDRFGQKEGVWICTFQEVKSLAFVLRDSLLKIYGVSKSQENKGEKMVMLYDYLTGVEFRNSIEAIVEGFVSMKDAIQKERMQMEKMWKEREKQLEKVLLSTSGMYGSLRGIAGSSVQEIKYLEE